MAKALQLARSLQMWEGVLWSARQDIAGELVRLHEENQSWSTMMEDRDEELEFLRARIKAMEVAIGSAINSLGMIVAQEWEPLTGKCDVEGCSSPLFARTAIEILTDSLEGGTYDSLP